MNFYQKVYEIVSKIPIGKVMTYGQIASIIGNSRASRAVGYALHKNPSQGIIPCHRVVDRNGKLSNGFAFGGIEIQKQMLEIESVKVSVDFFVDLSLFQVQ